MDKEDAQVIIKVLENIIGKPVTEEQAKGIIAAFKVMQSAGIEALKDHPQEFAAYTSIMASVAMAAPETLTTYSNYSTIKENYIYCRYYAPGVKCPGDTQNTKLGLILKDTCRICTSYDHNLSLYRPMRRKTK